MEHSLIPYAAVKSLGQGPALILAPHPDDEVLGCGGAIIRHVEAGDSVSVIVVTDGGHGQIDTTDGYIQQRKQESIRASRVLGCHEPLFWGLPDRGLVYGEYLVGRIQTAIEQAAARLVYAPSIFERHPDHRALGMAAVEAVRRQGAVTTLLMYEVSTPLHPNTLLDITEILDKKRQAIRCFTSQLQHQDYARHSEALNRFRTYTLPKEVEAAEAYFVVDGASLANDPLHIYSSEARRQQQLGASLDAFNRPLVSVIVRTVGRRQLAEALDSISLQTYPRIEVIVIDASGEGKLALGEWCGRFPLHVCGTGQPLPRSEAANLGLGKATGEFLIFLDDDDLFYPDHIENLTTALEESENAGVAYAGVRVTTVFRDGVQGPTFDFNEKFDLKRLQIENYIPIHAVLFARRLLAYGCCFDETLERYEDWDFWLQLAEHSNFIHIDKVSACYRSKGDSGFGIEPDVDLMQRAKSQFFGKWRQQWSGEQLSDLLEYAKNHWPLLVTARNELTQTRAELEECTRRLAEQERRLMEVSREITERDGWIAFKEQQLKEQRVENDRQLADAAQTVAEIYRSTSWRITAPLRWMKQLIGRVAVLLKKPAVR